MDERLLFDEVFKVDGYGLVIYFSDGTEARYTVDELAHMRPAREVARKIPSGIGPLNS